MKFIDELNECSGFMAAWSCGCDTQITWMRLLTNFVHGKVYSINFLVFCVVRAPSVLLFPPLCQSSQMRDPRLFSSAFNIRDCDQSVMIRWVQKATSNSLADRFFFYPNRSTCDADVLESAKLNSIYMWPSVAFWSFLFLISNSRLFHIAFTMEIVTTRSQVEYNFLRAAENRKIWFCLCKYCLELDDHSHSTYRIPH